MPNKHRWRIFTEPRGIWCKYTHTSTSSFVVINMRAACRNNVFMPCFSSHYLLNTLSRLELSSILFSLPFFFSLAGIYFCIILICFGYTRITRWPSALPIRSYISISFVRYAIDSIKCITNICNDDHDHQCGFRASHQSRCGWSARRKTCAQKV